MPEPVSVRHSVTFAREPLTDALWDEAYPLLEAHWREVAHFQDIPLEPDVARYRANEQAGVIRFYTAREVPTGDASLFLECSHCHVLAMAAGPCHLGGTCQTCGNGTFRFGATLVGYALYIVNSNPHYASSIQAVQDVIYLDPAVRGGTGYKFIKWCDEQLAAEGVQASYHHVKAAHNFGKLLERQGYELVDLIYAKRLDAPSLIAGLRVVTDETMAVDDFRLVAIPEAVR